MITDNTVCSRIGSKWSPEGLFASPPENLLATWCISYQSKYSKAPGREIEVIFEAWASKKEEIEKNIVEFMEKMLHYMSGEYENQSPVSSEYILDLAGKLFNRVRMQRVVESVESDLSINDVEKAQNKIRDLVKVDLGVGSIFKPGEDFELWQEALEGNQVETLVHYPKALGKFLEGDFCRECLVAWIGATGSGKSWWLLDLGYRAVRQRRRVAFFEVGDMSRNQFLRRMGQRVLRRPKNSEIVAYPVEFTKKEDPPKIDQRKLEGITPQECLDAWRKVQWRRDLFRLSCHSNRSVDVKGIESQLFDWSREGWVADIVIIDYADILAPMSTGTKDLRDQINETWMYLRRISQDFHCLVVTATQGDAGSYDCRLITRSNFTNDRRKIDHVTGKIGINSISSEKEKGITRLNWLKRRDFGFSEMRQIYVAGCLAIGCPVIESCY